MATTAKGIVPQAKPTTKKPLSKAHEAAQPGLPLLQASAASSADGRTHFGAPNIEPTL